MGSLLFGALLSLVATASAGPSNPHLHILPDASTAEYLMALENQSPFSFLRANPIIEKAKYLGARNLKFLEHLNRFRGADAQLRITKRSEGYIGIPIDSPYKYSPEILETRLKEFMTEMPPALRSILLEEGSFTNSLPVDEESYLLWARRMDRLYQTALRWTLIEPYLPYFRTAKKDDIRGHYFLGKEPDLQNKLRDLHEASADEQKRLGDLLVGLCQNHPTRTKKECETQFKKAFRAKKIQAFYDRYLPEGKKTWDKYFTVSNPRRDLVWNSKNSDEAILPFRTPANTDILQFLKFNIEEEWKWGSWQLRLDFQSNADVRVIFQPGVLPHVNTLGGNTINMDANSPLEEWDTQWTIRHEFGHVLGFNDCYVEFYDDTEKAMINYQLDVTNIMCATNGKVKDIHVDLLRAKYFTPVHHSNSLSSVDLPNITEANRESRRTQPGELQPKAFPYFTP